MYEKTTAQCENMAWKIARSNATDMKEQMTGFIRKARKLYPLVTHSNDHEYFYRKLYNNNMT